MLEPQMKSVPATCPLGMVGGGPHRIAIRKQRGMTGRHSVCIFSEIMSFVFEPSKYSMHFFDNSI